MNPWRPVRHHPALAGPPETAFRPPLTTTGIGGVLLLSGVITNMIVSTDRRPAAQAVRVAVAGFAVYLVVDQSFRKVPSGAGGVPPLVAGLGLAAVTAALVGVEWWIFR